MRRLLPVLLAMMLLSAAPATAAPWEQANESISCADNEGSSPFYNGPSASTVYDGTFQLGHGLPDTLLNSFIPQGLGTWPDWGGAGNDLLIQSGYDDDRSVIVGIVPGGGVTQMPQLKRPNGDFVTAHAGGVAVVASWLYVAGETVDGLPTILRFPLNAVRDALTSGAPLQARAEIKLDVGTAGFQASFLAAEGRTLWIGTFASDSRNRMYQFSVGPYGGLNRIGGADDWRQVPKKAQGLTVTASHFIFSTSWGSQNRSNIYVIRRGYKFLDNAYPQDLACFAAPSMSEGITRSNGQAFLTFESGSSKYRTDPCDNPQPFEGDCTRNIVTHLHRTPLNKLENMT